MKDTNPLLMDWQGDDGGYPPFDKVTDDCFKPALEQEMETVLASIDEIANSDEPPTFDNTIVEMENAFEQMDRIRAVYGVWSSSNKSEKFEEIELEMSPKLAAFGSSIFQNKELFKRIKAIYDDRDLLNEEQTRLVTDTYDDFVLSGAELNEQDKARLKEIGKELSVLFAKFGQNVLNDEKGQFTIHNRSDLDGLSDEFIESTKVEDKFAIKNTRSAVEPFLTYSNRRDLREEVWAMFVSRGAGNEELIKQMLDLRQERAKLLGLRDHASYRLKNTMAKNSDNVFGLLYKAWEPSVALVKNEVADMQKIADDDGITIKPWDYRYYAEKVRKQKYDIDEGEIKPYMQFDKMREAMFWVANRLFDIEFVPREDIPVFDPDMSVWDAFRSGVKIGTFYLDPFARDGKSSGAWMMTYRDQGEGVLPLASNNLNFIKSDGPVLVSWSDAETMFHEFGHALHGLCSNVTYSSLSGTNVCRDFVEFPSQLLEHWVSVPELLKKFAVHFETQEPMPDEMIEKITMASKFNQGFATVEYLSCALVDMILHTGNEDVEDPEAFEEEVMSRIRMPSEIVMRHRMLHFCHIFEGDSYSAGYYSYMWADVLSADGFEAFTERGDPFDREVADSLYKYVFSTGNTKDPAESYRLFRGRDPEVGALMREKGLDT